MVYESQSETSEVEVEVIALPEGAFHVASFINGIAYEASRQDFNLKAIGIMIGDLHSRTRQDAIRAFETQMVRESLEVIRRRLPGVHRHLLALTSL